LGFQRVKGGQAEQYPGGHKRDILMRSDPQETGGEIEEWAKVARALLELEAGDDL
jgi:hypothetical protein